MMKNIFILFLLISSLSFAQLQQQYNGQNASLDFQSPSSVGFSMLTLADVRYKTARSTLDNTQQEFLAQLSAPINKNMGFGLKMSADKYGFFNRNYFSAMYAYHLNISNYQTISLGTELSFVSTKFYLDNAKVQQGYDASLEQFNNTPNGMDLSLGLQYTNKNLYIGIDAANLLKNQAGYAQQFKARLHYVIDNIIDKFVFYPSVHFLKSETYQANYSIGLTGKYLGVLILDAKYASNNTLFVGGGFVLNNFLIMNYTYNYINTSLVVGNFNTHEIGLTVNIPSKKSKQLNRGFSLFNNPKKFNVNLNSHH